MISAAGRVCARGRLAAGRPPCVSGYGPAPPAATYVRPGGRGAEWGLMGVLGSRPRQLVTAPTASVMDGPASLACVCRAPLRLCRLVAVWLVAHAAMRLLVVLRDGVPSGRACGEINSTYLYRGTGLPVRGSVIFSGVDNQPIT